MIIATRQRTALIAFGVVFLVLFVNALVSHRNIARLRDSDRLVRHTYDVINAADDVLVTVVDAETGQRGFFITGDDAYLEPYNAAIAATDERLSRLHSLIADNPPQLQRLNELRELIQKRMDLLREGIGVRRARDAEGAKEFVTSGRGKVAMGLVRDKLGEIKKVERDLLDLRSSEAEVAYYTAVAAGAVAAILGLLLAVAGYALILRDMRRRERAAVELQAANDKLEDRVRERTETITKVIGTLREEVEVRRAAEDAARVSAEELRRSNRELEQFASVASHDLQEPLRKIQAFADRLDMHARSLLGEKGLDYLERILTSAARMRRLIDDLLAYSRVATKGQAFTPVDLNQVIEEVQTDLEERLRSTAGKIECETLPRVAADPFQMRQLFQNLLANALKFHRPDVPPEVLVTAQTVSTADGAGGRRLQVEVTVRDNGIGFDAEYRERIFDLFQRLHGRDQYEGTGIGLAICKKIVERHGGRIHAESAPGQGAAFIFTLPAAPTESGVTNDA